VKEKDSLRSSERSDRRHGTEIFDEVEIIESDVEFTILSNLSYRHRVACIPLKSDLNTHNTHESLQTFPAVGMVFSPLLEMVAFFRRRLTVDVFEVRGGWAIEKPIGPIIEISGPPSGPRIMKCEHRRHRFERCFNSLFKS
jgi:hypothetical protein